MFYSLKTLTLLALTAITLSACTSQSYRDIRPEHWRWWGANYDLVEEQYTKIKSAGTGGHYWDQGKAFEPGNWTYEFYQLGSTIEQQAKAAENQGDAQAAADLFHEASVYYGLAKYPYIFPTPAEIKAQDKQLETYQQSFLLEGYGYETIEIDFLGQKAMGFLHLPRSGNQPFPLVLGNNGLDVFAAESGPLVRDLLNRGIAVFTFDIAGTGKNNAYALTPDFEQMHLAFLDTLSKDTRLDASRTGAFGVSFAGNAMAKLAMTQQSRFKAIANICGPIHRVFMRSPAAIAQVEAMYRHGLVDRMKLDSSHPKSLAKTVKRFSLIEQGLLGNGQTTSVPVLSLNAHNDYVAPKYDMDLITDASEGGFIIWSGDQDHCPKERVRDMPKVAEFFSDYLL